MPSQTVVVMDTASLSMVHVARVHGPSSHPQLLHCVCKLSVESGEGRRAVVILPLYLHASCYTNRVRHTATWSMGGLLCIWVVWPKAKLHHASSDSNVRVSHTLVGTRHAVGGTDGL